MTNRKGQKERRKEGSKAGRALSDKRGQRRKVDDDRRRLRGNERVEKVAYFDKTLI
jgi:hypothetical protein